MFDEDDVDRALAGILAQEIASDVNKELLDAIYKIATTRPTDYVVKKGSAIFVARGGDVWVESVATRDICFSDANLFEDEDDVLTFTKMFDGVLWGLKIKKELVR